MKRVIAVIAVVLLAGMASCLGGGDEANPSSEDTESTDAGAIVYENSPEGDGVIQFVDEVTAMTGRAASRVCHSKKLPSKEVSHR